ncbi:anti-sigma factor antagonist [Streptomyces mayteni]
MTIEWRHAVERDLDILSVTGHLGEEAVRRFHGAIGWILAHGTGPVIIERRGWSATGQQAIAEAARRLGPVLPILPGPRLPQPGGWEVPPSLRHLAALPNRANTAKYELRSGALRSTVSDDAG